MDPFATLGIPRRFDLDLGAVEKTHRELSRALHPDRYAGASASERRAALTKAADVNEAWRTVRDPVRRAGALFALAGAAVGEDREPKPAPDFLMEVMEQREALAEAKAARDAARVRALAQDIEARAADAERRLGAALVPGAQAESLTSQLPVLGELRFYKRFLEEVAVIEEELEA